MHGKKRSRTETTCDKQERRKVVRITASLPRRITLGGSNSATEISPQDHLIVILNERGYDTRLTSSMTEITSNVTQERTKTYQHDLIALVRGRNVEELAGKYADGECVNPCNQFGESLLHMACRRGFTDVASFYINDCEESIRIRDDYGRTPVHDAFWTVEPNFDLIKLLIGLDYTLLLMKDKRNHCPLEYVREEHWGSIKKFFSDNKEALFPARL